MDSPLSPTLGRKHCAVRFAVAIRLSHQKDRLAGLGSRADDVTPESVGDCLSLKAARLARQSARESTTNGTASRRGVL